MKDYYRILGVAEDASPEDMKRAFRRLAFQYHPDRNPGQEKEAEGKFKEINEAYAVLSDARKRREYDASRRAQFAGVGFGQEFRRRPEDIFRESFADRAFFEELNRLFRESRLRFDEDFLNQVFFGGRGFTFRFYGSFYGPNTFEHYSSPRAERVVQVRKPGLGERLLGKLANRLGKFFLKKFFGIDLGSLPLKGEDLHQEVQLSREEAAQGCEKKISYRRGKEKQTLQVKIPAGVDSDTKIRLRGMGLKGRVPGDLYLYVKLKK